MKIQHYLFLCIFWGCLSFSCENTLAAARLYPERVYQEKWCSIMGGQTEVYLDDKSRVDCVLPESAIEFDFANKWSEAVGQSLYYSYMLKKKAGIVLIVENKSKDEKYISKISKIAPLYGITIWTVDPMFLKKNCN